MDTYSGLKTNIRELFARVKMFIDLAIDKQPHFFGEKIIIEKIIIIMEQQPQLNDHNKQEYPPMHTAEHLLNATMVKTFGCPRSRNAHIERKKSKCDYILSSCPTAEQIQAIENKVNEVISQNLPVTVEFMTHEQAKDIVDLSKLPADASETLRIIRIGDYDACACIGAHVSNTSEVGSFKIISYDYDEERQTLRLRFKLVEKK